MPFGPLEDGSGLTIVNEQLAEMGGAERIVEALRSRFPRALLVAPRVDLPPGSSPSTWDDPVRLVGPGGRRTPFRAPVLSRQMARERLAGLVLAVGSNSWAHAFRLAPGARHVALVHGLPRALYGHCDRYLSVERPLIRPALRAARPFLRREYRRRMRAPHRRIAVSHWSAAELERVHGVPWAVVNPPVDSARFTPSATGRRADGPVLMTTRLVRHKRIDVAMEAVRGLDVELLVVGGGPARRELEAAAPPNVRFAGVVTDRELLGLYRSASLFVLASSEEFGIAVAEAQAVGLPAIAPARGGTAEVIVPETTGLLVPEMTPASLRAALVAARAREWDSAACRRNALRFTPERFIAAIEQTLAEEAERLPQRRRGAFVPSSQAAAA